MNIKEVRSNERVSILVVLECALEGFAGMMRKT